MLLLGVITFLAVMLWAVRPKAEQEGRIAIVWKTTEDALSTGRRLRELNLIDSPVLFFLYSNTIQPTASLKEGDHWVPLGLSPRDVIVYLARLPRRPKVRVTIPEGYNLFQIAERLEHLGICQAGAFLRAAKSAETLARLNIEAPSVEGYLFPDTYELMENEAPGVVIERLVREMRRRLNQLDGELAGALGRLYRERHWSEKELLTLASIIEEEARFADEQPKIAGVFYNRLDDPEFLPRGRLQSDPTAAYGCWLSPESVSTCEDFDGKVKPQMLRDPQNPYNTYLRPGLPPGPISNPGAGAIRAAVVPEQNDYLFFFSKGDGRHTFSHSFDEHRRAVNLRRLSSDEARRKKP